MNRYFAYSCAFHLLLAVSAVCLLGPSFKGSKTTYTIDFIGSGKVVAMQSQNQPAAAKPAQPESEIKKQTAEPPQPPKAEASKEPAKKAYQSKEEISAKKQPKKKAKPVPLAAPSILDEASESAEKDRPAKGAAGPAGEGEFEGGNIQTDFATFPYPWYITQVRNSLWSEWEKRRPTGVTRGTLITFAIARDGKIRDLKVQKSSGDDSFDFAARSSVISAGPFPPLPMLYEKDELTVTLELKQEK